MVSARQWWSRRRRSAPVSAVEQHVLPLLPALYASALNLTGNEPDAEDLLHDLVLKLCRQPQPLESIEVLLPWLRRALYNLFVDRYRARQRSPLSRVMPNGDDDDDVDTLVSEQAGPEQLAEQADDRQRVRAALQGLSAEHRAVVVLHDIEGHSMLEITALLGIPVGTVKSRLFRARRQLLGLLGEGNLETASSVIGNQEVIR